MWALLWRQTEGRMSKQEFMQLTDRDIVNVLYRPGVHDKNPTPGLPYWPVAYYDQTDPPKRLLSWDEMCVEHWVTHGGMTVAEAEEKTKESGFYDSYTGPAYTPADHDKDNPAPAPRTARGGWSAGA